MFLATPGNLSPNSEISLSPVNQVTIPPELGILDADCANITKTSAAHFAVLTLSSPNDPKLDINPFIELANGGNCSPNLAKSPLCPNVINLAIP